MTNLKTLKEKAFQNEDVKVAYDALDAEFAVARSIIELRNNADLTLEWESTFIKTCTNQLTKGNTHLDKSVSDQRLITRWQLWVPEGV